MGDTWRETHDARHVKAHKKTSKEPDTTSQTDIQRGREVKTGMRRDGHRQPGWEHKGDILRAEHHQPESRTPPHRLGNKSFGRLHGMGDN